MFSHASDASKTGLVWLVKQLQRWDYALVDAQVRTETLGKMGAVEIARHDYLSRIAPLVAHPGRVGTWAFDEDFSPLGD